MSNVHQMLQARARDVQNRIQGRIVSYTPPEGGGMTMSDLVVVHGSAEDIVYETHDGPQTRRELIVRVNIGASAGQAERVMEGGAFNLDVDNAGRDSAWVIESFPNSEDGWRRCLCVRQVKQTGRQGMVRPVR